jgi:hypothetical protein
MKLLVLILIAQLIHTPLQDLQNIGNNRNFYHMQWSNNKDLNVDERREKKIEIHRTFEQQLWAAKLVKILKFQHKLEIN